MSSAQSPTTDRDRESTGQMQRVTFRIPERKLYDVESLVDDGEFESRSEAIRQAVRDLIREGRR